MAQAGDPNVERRRLGLDLRRAREAADFTQRGAAEALEWSLSKQIRIESGAQGISVADLKAMLSLYGIADPGRVAALTEAARGSRGPSWLTPYRDIISYQFAVFLGHESSAASLCTFHPFLVPGLLHTEDYAINLMKVYREPAGQPDRVRRITALRLERQERLFEDSGAKLSFMIGEEALYRWIGRPRVMRRQLEHLLEVASRPAVSIGIVPFRAGSHPGLRGPFTSLRLRGTDEEVLFLESFSGDLVTRDDPELISEYAEYFARLTDIALSPEEGNALLREHIDHLREAENAETGRTEG